MMSYWNGSELSKRARNKNLAGGECDWKVPITLINEHEMYDFIIFCLFSSTKNLPYALYKTSVS